MFVPVFCGVFDVCLWCVCASDCWGWFPLAGLFPLACSLVKNVFPSCFAHGSKRIFSSFVRAKTREILVLRPRFKAVNRRRSDPLPRGLPSLVRVRFKAVFPCALPVLRGQIQRAAVTDFLHPLPAFLRGKCPQKSPPKTGARITQHRPQRPKTPRVRSYRFAVPQPAERPRTPHGQNTGQIRPFERFAVTTERTPDFGRGFFLSVISYCPINFTGAIQPVVNSRARNVTIH